MELIAKQKGTLLDVRTPSEFSNGHIKNAGQLNFYLPDFRRRLLMLSKDEPVFLYCNTGYRSRIASEMLISNGYTRVYNLTHGIMEWELADLPVVVEPDARPDTRDKMEPDEFAALVSSNELVLIDFYAPWCAPCRSMLPMIDKLQEEYKGTIRIVKINSDASKKLIKELGVASVPYLVLYSKGGKKFEHSGIIEETELRQTLNGYRDKH